MNESFQKNIMLSKQVSVCFIIMFNTRIRCMLFKIGMFSSSDTLVITIVQFRHVSIGWFLETNSNMIKLQELAIQSSVNKHNYTEFKTVIPVIIIVTLTSAKISHWCMPLSRELKD
jgi:hypothetical protein